MFREVSTLSLPSEVLNTVVYFRFPFQLFKFIEQNVSHFECFSQAYQVLNILSLCGINSFYAISTYYGLAWLRRIKPEIISMYFRRTFFMWQVDISMKSYRQLLVEI